jgi:acetoin utilization protein AcuB
MIAEDLINSTIPPLKPSDTIQKALDWMNTFKLNQLPICDNGRFVGLITEEQLLDEEDTNIKVADLDIFMDDVTVKPRQHFYDIMKVASVNDAELVAVINDNNEYLGVVNVKDTVAIFGQMSAMQGPGGILVLRMNDNDYSLQQISRLIEENNAKILSLNISNDDNNFGKIHLTIKLNVAEMSRVIATLERFNFEVIATFQESELQNNNRDNLDLLMKYLSI